MVYLNLKKLLKDRGLSGYRLAKVTGLTPTTVYKLLKGNFDRLERRTIDELCKALDCVPGDIIKYRKGA
jgi:putative transcriptional regulator